MESTDASTILVTGGAGYIGSITAQILLEHGHAVRVVDDLSTGHRDAVPAEAEFFYGDLRDPQTARDACAGVGAVMHFAAKSIVGDSTRDPAPYWESNVLATRNVLEGMRIHGVARIVFSSTAAVYGDPGVEQIPETCPTRPVNPYGATKLAAEAMIGTYCNAYGIGAVLLRYFNVAGAYRHLGERHDPETHLIPRVLDGGTVTIFGDDWPTPDGTCIRDYIHVADLADAHRRALGAITPGAAAAINLGTAVGYSVQDVIAAAAAVTGREISVQVGPRRHGDPGRLVTDNVAARDVLGWTPTHGLDRIVADAWAFHQRGGR
jgi:UDP-glucose 4-epimerase